MNLTQRISGCGMKSLLIALLLPLAACSPRVSQDASKTDAPAAASAPFAVSSSISTASASSSSTTSVPEESDEATEHSGEPQVAPAAKANNEGSQSGPRIKGIALGQTAEQVHEALVALLPVGSACQASPDAARVVCEGIPQRLQGAFAFESGRLTAFKFYSYLSSVAFGRMSFNDFTNNFMNAYGIARMEPAQDNPMFSQYLRYRDDSGWEAGIYPDNTFYVKSVATASQQAKSFN
ncbi:hypothetical protein [Paraburkholderia dilworthii]|uniref:hypothetical protein n=1 Tax=Paraburkholderia dilworthii TaxID=948106 RepID=UPI0004154D2E|nr:hypothetical protein [Paraburkholderia dilworthii]